MVSFIGLFPRLFLITTFITLAILQLHIVLTEPFSKLTKSKCQVT